MTKDTTQKKKTLKKPMGSNKNTFPTKDKVSDVAETPFAQDILSENPALDNAAYLVSIVTDISVFTLEEVSKILKVTRRTLYTYIVNGELKAVKLGKDWRVKYKDLQDFIANLEYGDKK